MEYMARRVEAQRKIVHHLHDSRMTTAASFPTLTPHPQNKSSPRSPCLRGESSSSNIRRTRDPEHPYVWMRSVNPHQHHQKTRTQKHLVEEESHARLAIAYT